MASFMRAIIETNKKYSLSVPNLDRLGRMLPCGMCLQASCSHGRGERCIWIFLTYLYGFALSADIHFVVVFLILLFVRFFAATALKMGCVGGCKGGGIRIDCASIVRLSGLPGTLFSGFHYGEELANVGKVYGSVIINGVDGVDGYEVGVYVMGDDALDEYSILMYDYKITVIVMQSGIRP